VLEKHSPLNWQDCRTCGSTFDLPDAKAWNFPTLYKTTAETNNTLPIHEDRDETRNCHAFGLVSDGNPAQNIW
jgi:hypothetical protein